MLAKDGLLQDFKSGNHKLLSFENGPLRSYPDVPSRWRTFDLDDAPPFLTINYKWKNATLRLFSTLTTLGTPLDVALQELRIETLFPADKATRAVVNRLAEECLASQPS